jgi:murein DD-endopeptidase MepM/ murein hydrolase activator NlpD
MVARLVAAATAGLLACGAANASASAGGSSAGSAVAPGTPVVRDTICVTGCAGLHQVVVGSTVQVSGTDMAAVKSISFRSRRGHKRVLAPVTATTATSAQALVPGGAGNGVLRVRDLYGQKSDPGGDPIRVRPKASLRAAGPAHLLDAQVSPNKVFYPTSNAVLSFVVGGGKGTSDLRIDVVTSSGQVVYTISQSGLTPNTTYSVAWNGNGYDGRPVPDGWYAFRFEGSDGRPLARATASSTPNLGVGVFGFVFPVRGPHSFGGPEDGFGAPRAGHTHQGQDILAACGTPVVAARGGTVQYAGYQAAAGNYIVIDQAGSGEDNMYAHFAAPSPLRTGQKVATGQLIGNIGQTGDATGCHLHFEVWTAPGWYEGGHPYDPLPLLKAWDKYS